jgi:hypothetical protein
MFTDLHRLLTHLLADLPDEDGLVHGTLDAVRWLGDALAPVSSPDPAQRQAAVAALHAAWRSNEPHRAALDKAAAQLLPLGGAGAALAALIDALRSSLGRDLPLSEAELGAALEPSLDLLRDHGLQARHDLVAGEIRERVKARMSSFVLPFRGGAS